MSSPAALPRGAARAGGLPTRILGISGSLRAASSNTELLRAVAAVAPLGIRVGLFTGLDTLPHFNPDHDRAGQAAPEPVQAFRACVGRADAVLISSPEYAHGVPGSLKNALDWLVSDPAIMHKPVALLTTTPRWSHAQTALAEILRTMSMRVVSAISLSVRSGGSTVSAAGIARDPDSAIVLRGVLRALALAAGDHAGALAR